eukprot:Skav202633  [mRNA]  locus=scaffold1259:37280:43123:+ [translate_table: standard]
MGSESTGDIIEEVTILIAGLELTITARGSPWVLADGQPGRPTISASVGTGSASTGPTEGRYLLGYDPVDQRLIDRASQASGSVALGQLPLGFLDHLLPRLRSSNTVWTANARVGRAFRAGIGARLRLEGEHIELASEAVPFRSVYYLVLRCPSHPGGFWTGDYIKYVELVTDSLRVFLASSVSHGFASLPECEAYLMHTRSEPTKTLAPGSMLGLLHLGPGEVFRVNADDLTDFYYTFLVSPQRAKRNCIRMVFSPDELQHLTCFEPEFWDHSSLVIALITLAMGDSLAVEVAQAAHSEILRQLCGAMVPSETLRYRHPVPRGPVAELLAIDDHVTVQKLSYDDYPNNPKLRDTQIFDASERAYKHVKLIQQEKKRKRNQLGATILGCDFDGFAGVASAPRPRLIMLSLLTMHVVRLGTCTPNLLAAILGCWVHALLYRLVMFSILDSVFHEGRDLPKHQTFCLSRQSLNELQMLAVTAALAHSDLRAKYSKHLFTTDASPWGGAVCRAEIGELATQELWRHSEQKGFYTKLESPVSSILSEKGIPHEGNLFGHNDSINTLEMNSSLSSIPPSLREGVLYDAIELFRGTGNWSSAHSAMGLSVHEGVDNAGGTRARVLDLTDLSVFREMVALALRGVVRDWHAGVPCLSFGTLRRPRVRSKSQPFGFDPKDPFTALHNLLAIRTAIILILGIRHGAFISVEQPGSSCLFHMHLYLQLIRMGCVITKFCFCHYGSGFNKPSKWLHNKPWLEPLACSCDCPNKGKHFVVQGNFTAETVAEFDRMCRPSCQEVYGIEPVPGQAVSQFSGAYPVGLVTRMASGSVSAKLGSPGVLSRASFERTFELVGLDPSEAPAFSCPNEPPYPPRKWHEDPDWVGELCDSLPFSEMFRLHTFLFGSQALAVMLPIAVWQVDHCAICHLNK